METTIFELGVNLNGPQTPRRTFRDSCPPTTFAGGQLKFVAQEAPRQAMFPKVSAKRLTPLCETESLEAVLGGKNSVISHGGTKLSRIPLVSAMAAPACVFLWLRFCSVCVLARVGVFACVSVFVFVCVRLCGCVCIVVCVIANACLDVCLCVCGVCACLCICICVHVFECLPLFVVFACLFTCLFACLFVVFSFCLVVWLFGCLVGWLVVCVCACVCLFACLLVCLFVILLVCVCRCLIVVFCMFAV